MRPLPVKPALRIEEFFSYVWSLMCRDQLLAQRACQLADLSSVTPIFLWVELEESERIALRPVLAELAQQHLAAERELARAKARRREQEKKGKGAADGKR